MKSIFKRKLFVLVEALGTWRGILDKNLLNGFCPTATTHFWYASFRAEVKCLKSQAALKIEQLVILMVEEDHVEW